MEIKIAVYQIEVLSCQPLNIGQYLSRPTQSGTVPQKLELSPKKLELSPKNVELFLKMWNCSILSRSSWILPNVDNYLLKKSICSRFNNDTSIYFYESFFTKSCRFNVQFLSDYSNRLLSLFKSNRNTMKNWLCPETTHLLVCTNLAGTLYLIATILRRWRLIN